MHIQCNFQNLNTPGTGEKVQIFEVSGIQRVWISLSYTVIDDTDFIIADK